MKLNLQEGIMIFMEAIAKSLQKVYPTLNHGVILSSAFKDFALFRSQLIQEFRFIICGLDLRTLIALPVWARV